MELEYKIALASATIHSVLEDELDFARESEQVIQMSTLYFDTEGAELRKNNMMLRLRRENDRTVCCFKAPAGDARQELEVEAGSIEEGARLLAHDPSLPRSAAMLLKKPLACRCGADFVRIQQQCRQAELSFYLCADRGFVHGKNGSAAICELELELIEGSAEQLFEIAVRICDMYDGDMGQKSKSQRAFELSR